MEKDLIIAAKQTLRRSRLARELAAAFKKALGRQTIFEEGVAE